MEKEIIKLIKSNQKNIDQNLLKEKELEDIKNSIESFLDKNIKDGHILFFKYRKFKCQRFTPWSNDKGFPLSSEEVHKFIDPWINFFLEYLSLKTIKKRLEDDDFFIETRLRDEDEHILFGNKKDGNPKAHIVIDGKSGDIRVEDGRGNPEDHFEKIETYLTKKDGTIIKTTKEVLEIFDTEEPNKERMGIWVGEKAKGTSIESNEFNGFDIAIKDEGEGTKINKNKIN